MKKIHEDGHVTYYYYKYKKKRGRPKKRGPKKKKILKKRGFKPYPPFKYRIVICSYNKQEKIVKQYRYIKEVQEAKAELLKKNEEVIFPSLLYNNVNISNNPFERKCEYVVLKKVEENDETKVTKLRNEYGKMVDHISSSDKWIIYDKFECKQEESFWVYGYDNRSDRKDFIWILQNLVLNHIETQFDIIRIMIYMNKLLVQYDDDFEFVLCKHNSDAIRMYNLLEKYCKGNKQVVFTGQTRNNNKRTLEAIDMIMKKTGWTRKKASRSQTRN